MEHSLSRFRIGVRELIGVVLMLPLYLNWKALTGDPGVGWHMISGMLISESGNVPIADPFLFSTSERMWIHNQWLADSIFWKLFSLGGWSTICVLLVSTFPLLMALLLPRESKISVAGFVAISIASLLVGVQWIFRPVICSFILFALLYRAIQLLLDGKLSRRTVLFSSVPFFAVWVNLHPGFVMGIVLLGVSSVCAFLSVETRRYGSTLIFAMVFGSAATLLNPYGQGLHQQIWALMNEPFFMRLNQEWLAPELGSPNFWPFFAATATMILLSYLFRAAQRNLSWFYLLTTFCFSALGLYSRRYIPFAGIVMLQPLTELLLGVGESFSGSPSPTIKAFGRVLGRVFCDSNGAILLMLCASFFIGSLIRREGGDRNLLREIPALHLPRSAIQSIRQELKPAHSVRVFNHPDLGGYITATLWPEAQAYIDDRNELNGVNAYKEFFQIYNAQNGWKELFSGKRFDFVIAPKNAPLTTALQLEPGWELIFNDEKTVVYHQNVAESMK